MSREFRENQSEEVMLSPARSGLSALDLCSQWDSER